MGRVSAKKNKNEYQKAREALGLSREKASELTHIEANKIVRIENGQQANPWDIIEFAKAYKEPRLCNYYCANDCPIGQNSVPEITYTNIFQVVVEMIMSLNSIQKSQERLIEILVDGTIKDDEIEDFVKIQKSLKNIVTTAEALQLWTEKMVVDGKINVEKYKSIIKEKN